MDGITARFSEFEFYDIESDCDMVKLMCITSIGTWSTNVQASKASTLREMRKAFGEYVEESIHAGDQPHEVVFQ